MGAVDDADPDRHRVAAITILTRNQAIGGPFLRARVGRCERQREMLPNLLAVAFYERTGVVGIARDLNAEQP